MAAPNAGRGPSQSVSARPRLGRQNTATNSASPASNPSGPATAAAPSSGPHPNMARRSATQPALMPIQTTPANVGRVSSAKRTPKKQRPAASPEPPSSSSSTATIVPVSSAAAAAAATAPPAASTGPPPAYSKNPPAPLSLFTKAGAFGAGNGPPAGVNSSWVFAKKAPHAHANSHANTHAFASNSPQLAPSSSPWSNPNRSNSNSPAMYAPSPSYGAVLGPGNTNGAGTGPLQVTSYFSPAAPLSSSVRSSAANLPLHPINERSPPNGDTASQESTTPTALSHSWATPDTTSATPTRSSQRSNDDQSTTGDSQFDERDPEADRGRPSGHHPIRHTPSMASLTSNSRNAPVYLPNIGTSASGSDSDVRRTPRMVNPSDQFAASLADRHNDPDFYVYGLHPHKPTKTRAPSVASFVSDTYSTVKASRQKRKKFTSKVPPGIANIFNHGQPSWGRNGHGMHPEGPSWLQQGPPNEVRRIPEPNEETTPLIWRNNNPHRHHYDEGAYPRIYHPRQKSIVSRIATCLAATMVTMVIFFSLVGILFASTKSLDNVTLERIENVLASEQELMLDLRVGAVNPNLMTIKVDKLDASIFAKSPHVGAERDHDSDGWMSLGDISMKPLTGSKPDSGEDAQTMLLGRIFHFSSPLTFEGTPMNRVPESSVAQVRLEKPGNKTETGGTERWERVIQHPFELIVRGVVRYELPLSGGPQSAKIDGSVVVRPSKGPNKLAREFRA